MTKHKHRPCPCGCGELADECMRPSSALNAFRLTPPTSPEPVEVVAVRETGHGIRHGTYPADVTR